MRLVCPNCSAQYEIDGSMIPDEGRDVQCSNCGHTWFELPPPPADMTELGAEDFAPDDIATASFEEDEADLRQAEETAEEPDTFDDTLSDTNAVPDSDAEDDDDPADSMADMVAEAAQEEDTDSEDDDDAPLPGSNLKQRRPADAAALDILREEAEREMSQRRAPPSESIETQTDFGLEEVRNRNSPSRALRARMAHLGEDEPDKPASRDPERETSAPGAGFDRNEDEDDGYVEPRRDLLPDIDEINSTLKPARRRDVGARSGQGGFLAGFVLMLLVAVALILAYAQAPAIARAVPNAEGMLISYVDGANAFRDWISGLTGG